MNELTQLKDIDFLIATKLMGLEPKPCVPPKYSDDLNLSQQVLDRLWDLGFDFDMESFRNDSGAREYRALFARIENQEEAFLAFSASAPLAISLAALRAIGVELD